jgi:hypothetical protein
MSKAQKTVDDYLNMYLPRMKIVTTEQPMNESLKLKAMPHIGQYGSLL